MDRCFLILIIGWYLAAVETEEIFHPGSNDNVNSTEQILLRQENQLDSMVELLSQIRDLINRTGTSGINTSNGTSNGINTSTGTSNEVKCKDGFTHIERGNFCVHVNFTVKQEGQQQAGLTWREAQTYCSEMGADLAVFPDANAYTSALDFIRSILYDDKGITMDIWIGGTDEKNEDRWLWVNGDPMPRGTPFWGTKLSASGSNFIQEPSGRERQNCALLWYKNMYFIHDSECNGKAAPLCQHN